ncbi:MAG TPA: hypothetical protein VJ803_04745 [Gemmatimonadaceae bacterium]|nr:hypothetical protein [Gemmatimonadaceae bacterium]
MRRIEKNWLEWSVFGIGLLVVIGTLGFLVADSVANEASPPALLVSTGAARPTEAGFLLPVTVRNAGGITAENVLIEVVVRVDGRPAERAELRMGFVPRRAMREGWVVLATDPRSPARIAARAVAYEVP